METSITLAKASDPIPYEFSSKARKDNQSSATLAYQFLEKTLLNKSVTIDRFEQETFLKSLDDEVHKRFGLRLDVARKILEQVKKDILQNNRKQIIPPPRSLEDIFQSAEKDSLESALNSIDTSNGTSPLEFDRNFCSLDPRDQDIVKSVFENSKSWTAFKQCTLSKTTFYRRLEKLCAKEILYIINKHSKVIHYSQKHKYDTIILNPLFFCDFFSQMNLSHSSEGESSETKFVPLSKPSENSLQSVNEAQSSSFDNSSTGTKSETSDNNAGNSPKPSELSQHSFSSLRNFSSLDKPSLVQLLSDDSFDPKIIRSHNYYYKLPIVEEPANLSLLLSQGSWYEASYKAIAMNNWSRPKYMIKRNITIDYPGGSIGELFLEYIVQFDLHTISLWINNIFGRDPYENDLEADYRAEVVKADLEDQFPGLKLKKLFQGQTETTGKHHAWIHHWLALKCKQQNISLKGKNWEIDSSHDTPELESTDKKLASFHLTNELQDFDWRADNIYYTKNAFEDIQKNNNTLRQAIDLLKDQTELVANFSNSQTDFNLRVNQFQTDISTTLDQYQGIISINREFVESTVSFNQKLIQAFEERREHDLVINNFIDSINTNQEKITTILGEIVVNSSKKSWKEKMKFWK